ncbi:MAG: allophanate hydrolase [Betaproteobacteria bacterium]|nr:allophanate hydrolase [Betaproteobacteria bacterium]
MGMSAPITIAEIRAANAADPFATPEFVRRQWQALRRRNEQTRDPAWICLATAPQLEIQLAALAQRPPAECPLYGVPFAVKDNIDVAGWTTTAACPEFAYIATDTAQVVARLMQAGAVLLGKTNLDQFATGLVGTRSPYGWVPNAFSAEHISGGSSSGSASVVARGLVAFALGTDTAGSGRVPAGFNNLLGLKPTPGIVSNAGVVPACRTLDCVSAFTLTAADAAAVLEVIARRDTPGPADPVFHQPGSRRYALPPCPRVGIPRDPFFVSDAYRELFEASRLHLQTLKCAQGTFDLAPFAEVAALLYQGPWTAERYAVAGALIERRPPGIDPVVAEVIGAGKRYSAVDAFNALYRVRELEVRTRHVWEEFDVLMVPTAPCLPKQAEVAAEPIRRNSELGTYTNFVNLLGLSAVAVPFGFTADGLPFGVTFIARGGSDWALIECAAHWQRSRALPLGAHLRGPQPADTRITATPPDAIPLAVVGAYLQDMSLHHQLTARGARLRAVTRTAARYRLYALNGREPPKPGLARTDDGAAIAVEVYDMPPDTLGSLLAEIPPPLGLGTIELSDGTWVKGFICEPQALREAQDITAFGGWRAYTLANDKKGT